IRATTASRISFGTHKAASGMRARSRRKNTVAKTRGGLVSHTMRSNGRMLRRASSRARQESSPTRGFGVGGCIYFQYSEAARQFSQPDTFAAGHIAVVLDWPV